MFWRRCSIRPIRITRAHTNGLGQYWDERISLLDPQLFRPAFIPGHQKITDVYLLALAVRHRGRLATFDRSIPIKAVAGAESGHLELLG